MTRDLSRSLTSEVGTDRSMRTSPSTSPSRWKKPRPVLNSTTCVIGSFLAAACGEGEGAGDLPFWALAKRQAANASNGHRAITAQYSQVRRMASGLRERGRDGERPGDGRGFRAGRMISRNLRQG